jgi:nucleoside-diphosphate-sugar epimerase
MKILVTGAGGFIGSNVMQRLARDSGSRGYRVVVTARRSVATSPGVTLISADLSRDALDALTEDVEVIVHCAARASPWGDRELFWRDNVIATERLLAAATRAGTVRRLVHVSTPSIYFNGRDQLDRREDFVPPRRWPTAYAESKWAAECRVSAAPGLHPVILRPRAVFGPGDRAIVPRILAAAARGYLPLPGGGQSLIDVTYVDNVVDAIEAAAFAPADIDGRAYNITNGEPIVVRDLVQRLFKALDIRARPVTVPRALAQGAAGLSELLARLRPGKPEPRLTRYGIGLLACSQTLNIDAARRDLKFAPRVSINDGLARYAAWRKTQ